jgi:uncharacterized membrane protein (DUF485 family)
MEGGESMLKITGKDRGGDLDGRILSLAQKRLSIALWLSAAMVGVYFGFMALFAFNKNLLGTILAPGLSLCILLGPVVILTSFLLSLAYVVWANRVYDPGVRNLAE